MPEPTIEPTTIATLIHLPSIRDAGSGEASTTAISSVIAAPVAGRGRSGNLGAEGLRHPQMLPQGRQLLTSERSRSAVAAPCLIPKVRNVLVMIVRHVATNLTIERTAA